MGAKRSPTQHMTRLQRHRRVNELLAWQGVSLFRPLGRLKEPLDFSKFPLAKAARANIRGEKKTRPGCHLVTKTAFRQNLTFDVILKLLFNIPLA